MSRGRKCFLENFSEILEMMYLGGVASHIASQICLKMLLTPIYFMKNSIMSLPFGKLISLRAACASE